MIITVTITVGDDYPEYRKNKVPGWVEMNITNKLWNKGYIDRLTMQVDGEEPRDLRFTNRQCLEALNS